MSLIVKRLLCFMGLHNWHPQLYSYEQECQSNGLPLPIVCYCWNCGKKRVIP